MRPSSALALLLLLAFVLSAAASALLPRSGAAALRGDADCDGSISALDATILLQRTAFLLSSLPCTDKADADGDGLTTPVDATLILQRVAGLIQDFPSTPSAPSPTRSPTNVNGYHCANGRWAVRTLSDHEAGLVSFTPVAATVEELRAIPLPDALPEASRVAPTELTTYSVSAEVVAFKLEGYRDITLVIASGDDPAATMVVAFPDASQCTGAVNSAQAPEMRAARAQIVAAFGEPPTADFQTISGTATITGVGFFEYLNGETGAAPNGIELHPVLSFSLDQAPVTATPEPP